MCVCIGPTCHVCMLVCMFVLCRYISSQSYVIADCVYVCVCVIRMYVCM